VLSRKDVVEITILLTVVRHSALMRLSSIKRAANNAKKTCSFSIPISFFCPLATAHCLLLLDSWLLNPESWILNS
jgi:hypothetical protein